ncbi:MAG: diaminopimelate decarboxylase [Elusimicrobiota bacterium]|jgi:diaminopimelate decarboxylase|nr:diaminopimelate decarboxylase [Elusimicrobiota bacterium]
MFSFVGKDLFIENVKVLDIEKKYKTATYIYSKNKIIQNYKAYHTPLAESRRSGLICFAVKTNPNVSLLKILAKLKSGTDTVSGGEIYRSLEAGILPEKIVYAGVGKTAEEIEFALKKNIFMFNVESFQELEAIDKIAKKLKKVAHIAFRINPDVDPDTHSHIVTGKKGTKFGIPYDEALHAYAFAKKHKNVLPIGIHSHIGSQILDVSAYKLAAVKIKKITDELAKNGIQIEYINCGGGLGIAYKKDQKVPTPADLMKEIFEVFDADKKFIFEPGRSIIGDAGCLLTKVIYEKSSGEKNFLIVDAAMNDLIRPSLYDAYHEIIPIKDVKEEMFKTDVVGPVCESGDFLAKDRVLPRLKQGDFLIVTCTGAYGAAMASEYNLRPHLAQVLIDKDKMTLIRKRGQYKDLR